MWVGGLPVVKGVLEGISWELAMRGWLENRLVLLGSLLARLQLDILVNWGSLVENVVQE